MSDARQRLSRMPTTLRDRSDSRTSNTRGEPHSRSPFTTGWQPVRPRELPYQVLLVRPAKSLRTAGRAASSRRRGQRHDHTMHARSPRQGRAQAPFGLRFGRFGFATGQRPNRKSPHGGGHLVDLVDLVYLFRGGVCGARTDGRAPARARALPFLPPERTDQIDQIDQIGLPSCGLNLVDRRIRDQIGDQTGVVA